LHSLSQKVTVKEQKEWKVPPCISNWKNAKGYTIPLDKRLATDGRGLQQVHINEKFAKMAEALYIADRKAREAVEAVGKEIGPEGEGKKSVASDGPEGLRYSS
jgi:SNW domain-containing protein 1